MDGPGDDDVESDGPGEDDVESDGPGDDDDGDGDGRGDVASERYAKLQPQTGHSPLDPQAWQGSSS